MFLNIRTKIKVENSQTFTNSQRRISFNLQGYLCLQMEETILYKEGFHSRKWKIQQK